MVETGIGDEAGLLRETEIGARIGHGARTPASNGRRSAWTTMTQVEETVTPDYSEAIETITDHDRGPEVQPPKGTLQTETIPIEMESEAETRLCHEKKRRRSARKRKRSQHRVCLRSL